MDYWSRIQLYSPFQSAAKLVRLANSLVKSNEFVYLLIQMAQTEIMRMVSVVLRSTFPL